jgi:hypothetical protein
MEPWDVEWATTRRSYERAVRMVAEVRPEYPSDWCDQIDRADKLLASAHARARHRDRAPEASWPETEGPRITALARHDPDTGTVTLVLDATTASIAMFAVAAHAAEREAHAREVERSGADWPEGSYGRRNRQAIAARGTRVATLFRSKIGFGW